MRKANFVKRRWCYTSNTRAAGRRCTAMPVARVPCALRDQTRQTCRSDVRPTTSSMSSYHPTSCSAIALHFALALNFRSIWSMSLWCLWRLS